MDIVDKLFDNISYEIVPKFEFDGEYNIKLDDIQIDVQTHIEWNVGEILENV